MMIKLALVYLLAIAAVGAAHGQTCPLHSQGGVVLAVTSIQGHAASPQRSRPSIDPRSRPVASGVALCTDDILNNPAASGEEVYFRFSGKKGERLLPGSSKLVPAPTLKSVLVDLVEEFDPNFSSVPRAVRAGTRGKTNWRAVMPLPSKIRVVPTLGPLIFAWPEGMSGTVTVAFGARRQTTPISGVMRFDVATSCPTGCTLTISTVAGESRSTDILVAQLIEMPTPRQLTNIEGDPASRFVAGAWLADVQGDPSWRLQGTSLLWTSACTYPILDHAIMAFYSLTAPPDVCGIPSTF